MLSWSKYGNSGHSTSRRRVMGQHQDDHPSLQGAKSITWRHLFQYYSSNNGARRNIIVFWWKSESLIQYSRQKQGLPIQMHHRNSAFRTWNRR